MLVTGIMAREPTENSQAVTKERHSAQFSSQDTRNKIARLIGSISLVVLLCLAPPNHIYCLQWPLTGPL
ncbi:hypothetical protein K469DRAFT_63785 [Zopfia rhizophila CBS 207.26]|uniref:Uncharacterized protein n=1 Tax=Zopfia rhizophila CBS 207.26 TaxID=1314779 RepID=A0A6A6EFD3_9PEZI|nr:hypothetical protein K469DRAFT_63785 [Zopfia rhizophila CBS 207.26]